MEALEWLQSHWFTLLQSAGIVGGLVFTGVALILDARVRRVGTLINLTSQHRALWSELLRKPELAHILDPDADPLREPPTPVERVFISLIVLHLSASFRAAKRGTLLPPAGLRRDVRHFLSYPIPRTVWDEVKAVQDPDFQMFVDSCLAHDSEDI